jgi:hypothetical protein
MECERCNSDRILEAFGKTADRCIITFKGVENVGEVPSDLSISDGSGDYIKLKICLKCGQAQGMTNHPDPEFYTREKEQQDE